MAWNAHVVAVVVDLPAALQAALHDNSHSPDRASALCYSILAKSNRKCCYHIFVLHFRLAQLFLEFDMNSNDF